MNRIMRRKKIHKYINLHLFFEICPSYEMNGVSLEMLHTYRIADHT